MRAFISYAHSDSELRKIEAFEHELSRLFGLPGSSIEFVEVAPEVASGDDARSRIRDAIRSCDVVAVLWTGRAAQDDGVQYELAMADAFGKRTVVLKQPDAPEVHDLLRDCEVIQFEGIIGSTFQRRTRDVTTSQAGGSGPSRGKPFVEPKTGIEFLWIPDGRFQMGSTHGYSWENTVHWVKLTYGFWLAKTPITNNQYADFVRLGGDDVEPVFWRDERFSDPDQPVVGVSWLDARAFCRWLQRRTGLPVTLPSEAQWEFAARGDNGTDFPWGNERPDPTRACFGQGRRGRPVRVGQHPNGAGPFGTLDQAGLVWEWCRDYWKRDAYTKDRNRHGDTLDPEVRSELDCWHVVRGGSWLDDETELRSTYRGRLWENCCSDCRVGLRVMICDPRDPQASALDLSYGRTT